MFLVSTGICSQTDGSGEPIGYLLTAVIGTINIRLPRHQRGVYFWLPASILSIPGPELDIEDGKLGIITCIWGEKETDKPLE